MQKVDKDAVIVLTFGAFGFGLLIGLLVPDEWKMPGQSRSVQSDSAGDTLRAGGVSQSVRF